MGDTKYTLFPGIDVLPVNPDNSCAWNVVTLRDTVFYSFGQDLHYFMPWSIKGLRNIKIDFRLLEYPWENELSYAAEICGKVRKRKAFQLWHLRSCVVWRYRLTDHPRQRGGTGFSVFYSPGFISYTAEYLTCKLLEYTPDVMPE